MPEYTESEEIINMITHIIGAVFGITELVLCVVFAAERGSALRVIGASVYGTSLIMLYAMSSLYHGLNPGTGKKVLQVLDHCTIYFLIAGTYTPILIGPLYEYSPSPACVLLGVVWGIGILAAVFTAIDRYKYRKLSMACYVGLGWTIILTARSAIAALTWPGFLLLLGGGIAYTAGAVIYSIGKKRRTKYMHSVFHILVLLGTLLHFLTIFIFCILN